MTIFSWKNTTVKVALESANHLQVTANQVGNCVAVTTNQFNQFFRLSVNTAARYVSVVLLFCNFSMCCSADVSRLVNESTVSLLVNPNLPADLNRVCTHKYILSLF